MAESTVTIKIEVNADTRAIDRVQRKLAALSAQSAMTGKKFDDLDSSVNKNNKSIQEMGQGLTNAQKKLNSTNKFAQAFGKTIQSVSKLGLKAFAISLGAAGLALVAVNAAFVAGTAIVKAYRYTMSGLFQVMAGAGASAVAVLSALAAGQREYNAALQASRYGGGAGGLKESATQMRSLTSDTRLAVLGAEALNGAFAAISRQTRVTGTIQQAMVAMGNFAAASGDPAKAFTAAGEFIGQLVSKGKLTAEVINAAGQIGPEFERAVKDAQKRGITSSDAFLKALVGGDLGKEVAGQLDLVNQTLFGTFKRNFQLIKEQFADFGQPLLGPFTQAMEKVALTFRRTFAVNSGLFAQFAGGTFVDVITNGIDKLGFWATKMFTEYLPRVEGMFGRISGFFDSIGDGWNRFLDVIRPLREGGKILTDTFGPALKTIFGGFGSGLYSLNDLITENKDEFLQFGQALANLFKQIGELFGKLREAVVKLLPFFTKLINGLASVIGMLGDVVGMMTGMGSIGSAGALGLLGLGYFKAGDMAKSKTGKTGGKFGRFARAAGPVRAGGGGMLGGSTAGVVNITASTVYLNGPVAGAGAPRPGGPPPVVPGSGPGGGSGGARGRSPVMAGGGWGMAAMIGLPLLAGAYGDRPGGDALRMGANIASMTTMASALGMKLPGLAAGAQGTLGGALAYAAPLAGGAIAGNYASNMAIGRMANVSGGTMTMGSVAAGAGAGALGGAAMGAAIGAFGGPIGAGVGAALGLIAGGIMGWVNSGKVKKQSRQAAEGLVENFTSPVEEMISSGNLEGANDLLNQMNSHANELRGQVGHVESFNKKYEEQAAILRDQVAEATEIQTENLDLLATATGLSTDKIRTLADEMGMNLVATIDDVGAAIEALTGYQVLKPGAELTSFVGNEVARAVYDSLNAPIIQQEKTDAMYGAGRTIQDIVLGGGQVDQATAAKYLMSAFEYELASGADAGQAIANMTGRLGFGGGMYGEGFQFAGMEQTLAPLFVSMITGIARSLGEGDLVGSLLATASTGILGSTDNQMGINIPASVDAVRSSFQTMSPEEIVAYLDSLRSFSAAAGSGAYSQNPKQTEEAQMANIESAITSRGLVVQNQIVNQTASWWQTILNLARTRIATDPGQPPTDNLGNPTGDTTSSRLKRTLGRHRFYDSNLVGKRMITSAFRTNNLGSMNSDHLTGNAYDLIGQNLGGYAAMVNRSGGFAEFHGRGGGRHLHVVPGETPVGDTMAPIPSLAMGGSSNTVSNSYSFQINGGPNATASDIADEVMTRIYRKQRSEKERY